MVDWGKLFKCPPKQDTQCEADLAKCNTQLQESNNALAIMTGNLQTCNIDLGTAAAEAAAAKAALAPLQAKYDELIATSKLLTEGPVAPTNVRWVSQQQIDALLNIQMGAKYSACPAKHFTESDYLVCSLADMKQFIAYYAMFWMPHLKYTTQKWTKLDGSQVEIWMMDCDDFADFFQGIGALNANWACFPWGKIWAEVQGLFIAGGHAFNCFVACDDTYIEIGCNGLKAYILEPQMAGGGPWPASKAPVTGIEVRELTEVTGAFKIIGTIWMLEM